MVDIHTHKVYEDVDVIYNVRINEQPFNLPHGPNIFFSVGIHPWDTHNYTPSWLSQMEFLLSFSQVVAIGECGLDKNAEASYEQQLEIFKQQVRLSEYYKKHMIIHCVGFFNEIQQLKTELEPKQTWIIHGFRGKPQMAEQLAKKGFGISFGEKFNPESVKNIPWDQLFFESDESTIHVEEIRKQIAAIRECEPGSLHAGATLFKVEQKQR